MHCIRWCLIFFSMQQHLRHPHSDTHMHYVQHARESADFFFLGWRAFSGDDDSEEDVFVVLPLPLRTMLGGGHAAAPAAPAALRRGRLTKAGAAPTRHRSSTVAVTAPCLSKRGWHSFGQKEKKKRFDARVGLRVCSKSVARLPQPERVRR